MDLNTTLNLLLVLSFCTLIAGAGFAFTTADQTPPATEFYLLTESSSGELVSGEYASEFRPGENHSLVVGITNNDAKTMDYTIVVVQQRVTEDRTQVISSTPVRRFRATVEGDGAWRTRHQLSPESTGTNLRIQYRLYRGAAPPDVMETAPYRKLHLWITVTEGAS